MELIERRHPGGDFLHAQLVAQHQIALGNVALLFKRPHLHLELVDLVVDAKQVFLGFFKLALSLLLPVAEAGDTGSLLKNLAPVGGLVGDDLRDAPLPDDRIAVAPETCVHQQRMNVLETHRLAVDVVFTLPAAVEAAGEHDLRGVVIKDVGGVVDNQRDLRKAKGISLLGAAEDHILHLRAAQRLGALLAHDPEDGVGDVRFAGAVRTDDGRNVLFKCQPGLVRKGLKTLDFQCF